MHSLVVWTVISAVKERVRHTCMADEVFNTGDSRRRSVARKFGEIEGKNQLRA